jgi:hypothetical protein
MKEIQSKFYILWNPTYGYLSGSSRHAGFSTYLADARKFSRKNHATSCRTQKFGNRKWIVKEITFTGYEKPLTK